MAFFEERVEKGVIAKLQGIVESQFVRMRLRRGDRGARSAPRQKFEFPVQWGMDLQSEHERYLTEEHAKRPVIVMNYPKGIKAFYMRMNDDGRTVAAMDVLAPGIGEIIGGSQREERLDVLDARMARGRARAGALRVVPRSAPLRHRAARRLRPGIRAHGGLRHRPVQRARRHPLPAHAGQREATDRRKSSPRLLRQDRMLGEAEAREFGAQAHLAVVCSDASARMEGPISWRSCT